MARTVNRIPVAIHNEQTRQPRRSPQRRASRYGKLPRGNGPGSIEAIIFDLGNVLLAFSPWTAVHNLAAVSGRSPWLIAAYFLFTQRWTQFDEGRLSRDEFIAQVSTDLRLRISPERFEQAFADIFLENTRITALLPGLADRFRLFLLSDNNPLHAAHCLNTYRFLEMFEERIFSFDVRHKKPHPAMFERLLERAGLPPQSVLFIDDKPGNVRGAERLGIPAVTFRSEDQFLALARNRGWID